MIHYNVRKHGDMWIFDLMEEEVKMDDKISERDIREFVDYLKQCTDSQIRGCYEKEKTAGRRAYMALCEFEARNREIEVE